ncbi:ferritin-like domain-containing protein [Kordiimonas laminariae]|uniref:ferritin-like domain-containing protein n=1 Tax=Kordiimonas laminariae TaxID=2917717 RepID=UPI001FF47045|nr:ferritin-like domain-containing protein [Kordiimonas laminariae]MCK0069865.1 ferritin-like domain-containing protein [Kordiimonas laminariae]
MSIAFENIGEAAIAVLKTEKAREKAERARMVAAAWKTGRMPFEFPNMPPDRPARPKRPELLDPAKMPKRRKGGTDGNRRALLHAVAHIELNAIDLAFDIVARFGAMMPRSFTDDWIKIGDDEARHFTMLSSRLRSLDCLYGDLPAHDGLWQSAIDTKESLPARLAIVPMVLEARGLDVTPNMIEQFRKNGDEASADVLKTIYEEEISHVAAGSRWFKFLAQKGEIDPEEWFQDLVQAYFKGQLKRPFNVPARNKAGMPVSFYEPLADMLEST